ncbi:hypothetical protein C8R44DRAFT_760964 [Mycena epipterygia]|nr:hypothetical protein C8R44DRAFT_760964 [Mycena epipterygia]
MFEVAQAPSNVDSQIDGCPLVHLYDDKAEEVELVLDALYDRNFYKNPQKTFPQVAAMWRLGKKYGFDELHEDGMRRLEQVFPSTLSAYQALYRGPTTFESLPISTYSGLLVDAINLARDIDLNSILPAALYRACSQAKNLKSIHRFLLSGVRRPDGVLCQLSDVDKMLCILATSDLLEKQWEGPYSWVRKVGKNHHAKGSPCRSASKSARIGLGVPVPDMAALRPAIRGADRLCVHCKEISEAMFAAGQQALWEELPSIFGLPSWADIKKQASR